MEPLVLLGGFFAFVVFGFFLMGRLDRFLDGVRAGMAGCEHARPLQIAVSNPYAVAPVAEAVEAFQARYPGVECRVSLGPEREIMHSLDSGAADVAVVSPEAADCGRARCACFTFRPQPLSVDGAGVTLPPLHAQEQRQKVLWKDTRAPAPAQNFVRQLCGQGGGTVL